MSHVVCAREVWRVQLLGPCSKVLPPLCAVRSVRGECVRVCVCACVCVWVSVREQLASWASPQVSGSFNRLLVLKLVLK